MRRLIGPAVGVLVAVGGVLALLLFFSGRDSPGVPTARVTGPGRQERDLGDRHLADHDPRPDLLGNPPTSGPHRPVPVPGDRVPLDTDQVLHALELGNVVILYPGQRGTPPPPPLAAVQSNVAGGRSTRSLIDSGQAVILSPEGGPRRFVAVAWRHRLIARGPDDPRLLKFADFWSGTTPSS